MNKDYLPSRQFITRIVAIAIILAVALGIYGLTRYLKNRAIKHKANLVVASIAGADNDSNENGIPDWEEKLWGLDPSKNGTDNKAFIEAKRAAIAEQRPDLASNANGPLSENDILSRDFFAIVMSLQQGGQLDESSIQAVGNSIGKSIEATPIPDIYTRNMIKVVESNPDSVSDYYGAFLGIVLEYDEKNIGDELTFISQGIQNKDPNAIKQIKSISDAYKAFGKDFIKIPVPNTLVAAHLNLANDYEKVGQSVAGLTDVLSDPLNGIRSFINYKTYTDALTNDLDLLSGN